MPRFRVPIGNDGPVIDLAIWIDRAMAHSLVALGLAVPPPHTVRELIDTSADRTAIHPAALAVISSFPAGTSPARRPRLTTAARRVNLHRVRLAFGGGAVSPITGRWVEIESAAVIPADPAILALIGRDMLARCRFVYDGPKGELILVC